jgi:hypothetical protein
MLIARLLDGSQVTLDENAEPLSYLRSMNPNLGDRWLSFVAERSANLAMTTTSGGVVPPRAIVLIEELP